MKATTKRRPLPAGNVIPIDDALAPHGLRWNPPEFVEVIDLIRRATVEGVARSAEKGTLSWLLIAFRFLIEHAYQQVFELGNTPREERSIQEQNQIFRLNNYYRWVQQLFAKGDDAVGFSHDDFNLQAWTGNQRIRAEYEEAKASLPPSLRDDDKQIRWVLREKEIRKRHASEDWHWRKYRKERAATATGKELANVDASHAERVKQREAELAEEKKTFFMSGEERQAYYKAKRRREEAAARRRQNGARKAVKAPERAAKKRAKTN